MNRQLPRPLLSLLLLLLTAGVIFILGCGGEPAGDAAEPSSSSAAENAENGAEAASSEQAGDAADGVAVYHVRGEILELPDPDDPLSGLYIRHEAIDNFRNMDGEVSGMDSMTMAFPAAEDLTFEGIEVGDKVSFELTVDYSGDPVFQVTSMEALPEDTELHFGATDGPASS